MFDEMEEQKVSFDIRQEKYAKYDEKSSLDIFRRVARGIAQGEKTDALREEWEVKFLQNMINGAVGAGRIMSAAGTPIQATLANCFVQPVGDCIKGLDSDGLPGIYTALADAAETMRRGGGVGYDFSNIRPRNARVNGTASSASGPCSYMDVFDKSCETVESAGSRRGAQMGVLRIDHPDILEFIRAKRTEGRWKNFNVSVAVSDAFMQALQEDKQWELVHKAKPTVDPSVDGLRQTEDGKWIYSEISARDLWQTIMQSTYDFAEPGVLFMDHMNRDNNLSYCEIISATNPCAEQPLPNHGCCDLGPIILPRFITNHFGKDAAFDFRGFENAVAIQVRFLDNVLDVTHWPLEEQKKEAQSKRRIGVGFTGLGNVLAMLNLKYNEDDGRAMAAKIACSMRDAAYTASVNLAAEKGAFPLLDIEKYLADGTFASRLPESIKTAIREHGIRNSHLVSIAPTGTVSLAFADNASSGIEPPFALSYDRKKRMKDGEYEIYHVLDHGFRVFVEQVCVEALRQPLLQAVVECKSEFVVDGKTYAVKEVLPESMITAMEMLATDHLAMVAAVQLYIDTSISKTVNVAGDYPYELFKDLYMDAWMSGLKGLATYRPNATRGAVLTVGTAVTESVTAAPSLDNMDPLKVVIENSPDGKLAAERSRIEYTTQNGSRSLYMTISFLNVEGVCEGKKVVIERPIEVFIPSGQSDVPHEYIDVFCRQLSLNARSGFGFLVKALHGIRDIKAGGHVRFGWHEKADGSRVPRFHETELGAIAYAIQRNLFERGFLDVDGNQVPTKVLVRQQVQAADVMVQAVAEASETLKTKVIPGKECLYCGAHAVIKSEGCERCTNCGEIGACG